MLDAREIMNSREAAEFLRVNPETVIREARAGRLPGRRIGKEWRFSRTALLEWLARGPDDEDRSRYKRNVLRAVHPDEAHRQGV
jgi:excisionase family DNA binding protein